MSTKPPAQSDPAIDLDFTGVFRIEELRLEPAPPVPKRPPEDIVIGARAIKKGNSFINMARSRPARRIDPAQTTILLVEDDTTTRLIIDVICRKAGYLTRQAADAPSFIAAMQKSLCPTW